MINDYCLFVFKHGNCNVYLIKECDENYFGLNCKEQCNATCKSCNKSTGVCDNGCYAGWEGEFCEKGIYP